MNIQDIKDRYSINNKFYNFQEDEDYIDFLYVQGYTLYEDNRNHDIITYCEEFDNELNILNDYTTCIKL